MTPVRYHHGLLLVEAPGVRVCAGPGPVVIALALAVFAIEYQWARRNFVVVQARARSAALKAAASRVATASAVLFGMGAIGLGGVLVFTDLLPLSGVGTVRWPAGRAAPGANSGTVRVLPIARVAWAVLKRRSPCCSACSRAAGPG